MQFYIKIFNKETNELVGYYKETGINCVSKMQNGMKYFNTLTEAMCKSSMLDGGFIRDKDGKYYNCHTVVYGDNKRTPSKTVYRNLYNNVEGDESESAIDTFIRQNRGRNRR